MKEYNKEHQEYLKSLLSVDKKEIIRQAYKIHLIEEIVYALDYLNYQGTILSLEQIYEEWLDYDDNLFNEVKDFIETLLKEQNHE